DVRSVRYNEFSRPKHAPRHTHVRLCGKQLNAPQDSRRNCRCVLRIVFRYIIADADEMPDLSSGPSDFHRGALLSDGLPHDLSHFATFSWLTLRPSSRSARPARISASCQSSASTYCAIASAARKDFERLESCTSASRRFFVCVSSLIERVSVIACVEL